MIKDQEIGWLDASNQAAESPIVSGGKIHLLGLDNIKQRLGDKWDRMSELVHRYFEAAIRREMSPGDTFHRSEPLSYLVLFRGATIAETQLKCRAIAKDVCDHLFGEEDDIISVRNLTLAVGPLDLANVEERGQLDELLERDGREAIFHHKAQEVVEQPLSVSQLNLGDGAGGHAIGTSGASFLYRPLWDSVRGAVLTYICQPVPAPASQTQTFTGLCVTCENDNTEQAQFQLDERILQECLQRVQLQRSAGARLIIAAPLHFSTLSRSRYWVRYAAHLANVPFEIMRDIAFIVHGISPNIPNIRLSMELPKLTVLSKRIFCLVERGEGIGHQFRNTGIQAIGLAFQPGVQERDWLSELSHLSREARDAGFESFGLGAARRCTAVNAVGAGIRYLEGKAVRPAVADPKYGFAHEIEDLYRTLLTQVSAA
jgi:hypothetical protein